MRRVSLCLAAFFLLATAACGPKDSEQSPAVAGPREEASVEESKASPQDLFWNRLTALCGKAFEGAMVSADEADTALAGQVMTMHVRRCSEDRIEIPFHVGENRSRTWVLTRLGDGLQLQHDHRHEDGSEDVVTLYGGRTTAVGTEDAQHFPADDYSKKLFEENQLAASVVNIWSLEIEPGERFSYILRRPQRHFQADFDLRATVPEPPTPWGH